MNLYLRNLLRLLAILLVMFLFEINISLYRVIILYGSLIFVDLTYPYFERFFSK